MLVVSPRFLRPRWGEHRPPHTSICLLASFFLSLLAASTSMIAEASQSNFQCHLPRNPAHGVTKKHLYIKDKEQPITLMTSRRISHHLLTHVVAIFLRQHLGFSNVLMTYEETFHPDELLSALGYQSIYSYMGVPDDFVPKAMVNLELWVPPGYNDKAFFTIESESYLGIVGRLGWFFPSEVIETYDFIGHWRIFTQLNSSAHRIFGRTDRELDDLLPLMKDPEMNTFYCSDPRCKNGIFTPLSCVRANCAVLFSSYFNSSGFLIDNITNANLSVRVAWLGPNLNKQFIRENIDYPGGRSVLIFHYTPDVIIRPFNLTSITFPPCMDYISNLESNNFCMYEMHRFHKFVWSDLKQEDSYLYESLERIFISADEHDSLMAAYNDLEGSSLEEIACHWMQHNEKIWTMWKNGDSKPSLYLLGFFPVNNTSDKRKFLAPGTLPAFNMAVDAVNNNDSILSEYTIQSRVINTGCEPDVVMLEFIRIVKVSTQDGTWSKLIGIVGPACSDTVEPIAGVSKYFKMPIISYGAEGAIFSDRVQYPYFFRTIPENKIFRHVYLQLFMKLKWARVASLTEDGHQYSEYLTPLQDLLQDHGITFNMRKYPQEPKLPKMTQYLTDIKKQSFTIIIGDFYEDVARVVLCEAFHQKMTGNQGYVWFLPRWYSDGWYDVNKSNIGESNPVNCTTKDMLEALQGHMSLSYKFFADDDKLTPENITVKQWREKYREKVNEYRVHSDQSVEESEYAGFTYDAVWTFALALDKLFKEDLTYTSNLRSSNTMDRFVNNYINKTNFDGVSGHVNFTNGPSRVTDVVVWQFTDSSYVDVGCFYNEVKDQYEVGRLDLHEERLKWPLNVVPKDGGKECIVEPFRLLLGGGTSCVTAIIIICTISFGGLAALLIISVVCLKQRYEHQLRAMEEVWRDQSLYKKFEGWEIPRSKVVINRKLGEGQFGTVYGGECFVDNVGWEAVAVKTLKVGSTIGEKLDFLSEAEMMKKFDHDNIIKLLGVCTESEPIYTVMEFMLYGDLKTYLLARRNLVNEKNRNDDDEVSNRRLTSMALDVANALAYLAEMKYVHRDVACRNCLVNAHRNVKLADFGMTRPLNEKNYYRFSRKGMLPVRWMAPESLVDGIFTPASDMWSYGVLLYEIITFGAFPFQGLTNHQVFEKVKNNHTLPIPVGINQDLECLLQACWHQNPVRRMTAAKVAMHLQNSPRLISPSLDAPQSSVTVENPAGCEMKLADKSRKLSLSLNSRALSQGLGGPNQNITVSSGRKRSFSGNMVMTSSLSEDGIMSTTLDALNLNQTLLEEHAIERDSGEDPLLPHSHYISATRYMTLSHKDVEREREALIASQKASISIRHIDTFGVPTLSHSDKWTHMTPV